MLVCPMKATWLLKLRYYLQSNFRFCLDHFSSLYLQQLCSNQEGETFLKTQLQTGGEAGEGEMVPNITSSSKREGSSRKHLEFDKEIFLSEVSTNLKAISKILESLVAIVNYINKILHGLLFKRVFISLS